MNVCLFFYVHSDLILYLFRPYLFFHFIFLKSRGNIIPENLFIFLSAWRIESWMNMTNPITGKQVFSNSIIVSPFFGNPFGRTKLRHETVRSFDKVPRLHKWKLLFFSCPFVHSSRLKLSANTHHFISHFISYGWNFQRGWLKWIL